MPGVSKAESRYEDRVYARADVHRPRRADSRRLHIGLISEEFPPETGWGGIGTYTYNLARGLVEQGHRVHVYSLGWEEETVDPAEGLTLHRVPIPEPVWRRGAYWFHRRFWETRQIVAWGLRIRQAVHRTAAEEPLDILESPEYHAQGLFAVLGQRRLPMVVRLHMPSYLCRRISTNVVGSSRWDTLAGERLEFYLARRAQRVVSASRDLAAEVARAWSLDESRLRIIPLPIDEDRFRPAEAAAAENPTLLYVGRVSRLKGIETLFRALPEILGAFPRLRVRVVGKDHPSGPDGGSMRAHLESLLRQARLPEEVVQFTGPLPRADLPEEYRRAAVCVIPSLYESFGYTCLEAMASGTAVVASAAGGLQEILTDQVDGLLTPPGCPETLASAVMRLLADSHLRRRLGQRARETVSRRYSRRVICTETARLYESVAR